MSTGARAMATALVLEADGRRENGRWRRGSVDISKSGNSDSQWGQRLAECGVVLDFKPDLATEVVSGATTLNDAFTQAEKIRTSAERDKIMAREKAKREKAEAAAEAPTRAARYSRILEYRTAPRAHGRHDNGRLSVTEGQAPPPRPRAAQWHHW